MVDEYNWVKARYSSEYDLYTAGPEESEIKLDIEAVILSLPL